MRPTLHYSRYPSRIDNTIALALQCLVLIYTHHESAVVANRMTGTKCTGMCDEPPASMSLDGAWDFETDATRVGTAERWFDRSAHPLGPHMRSVTSPGAWQAQYVGNETELMTNQYVGVGW